jgi:hypothetical protein
MPRSAQTGERREENVNGLAGVMLPVPDKVYPFNTVAAAIATAKR